MLLSLWFYDDINPTFLFTTNSYLVLLCHFYWILLKLFSRLATSGVCVLKRANEDKSHVCASSANAKVAKARAANRDGFL